MEYFTLYNGVKIPKVGFGTYKVIDQSAQGIVETALSVGYRHLDTARMYLNEKEVGAGIAASGCPSCPVSAADAAAAAIAFFSSSPRTVVRVSLLQQSAISVPSCILIYPLRVCLLYTPSPYLSSVWRAKKSSPFRGAGVVAFYCCLKNSLPTPQRGHVQLSGSSSKGVSPS